MTRAEILDTAKKCVCGDREQDYGSPENNFKTISSMWNSYLYGAGLIENHSDKWKGITAVDVAAMLALLKIARIASGHAKADNWVDLAGYAACGGEIESNNVAPSCAALEHETSAEAITPETLEELFRGYTNSTIEPVKGKYEGLSDKELYYAFCTANHGDCQRCLLPNFLGVGDRYYSEGCAEWKDEHPEEFRKIAITYLEGLEGKA